jgi:hypothetical protein
MGKLGEQKVLLIKNFAKENLSFTKIGKGLLLRS